MGLGIAGVACLLMCAGTAVTSPTGGASGDRVTERPRVLLAQAPTGSTVPSQDSAQPNAGLPSSAQEPATGGSGAQQAPATGTAPGSTDTAAPNNTAANPGMSPTEQNTGGSGTTGAGANPNTGGSGTPEEPNALEGGPSADPNPEARSQGSNQNQGNTSNRGTDANTGTGGTGNSGSGAPAVPPAPAAQQGIAVVDAIYRGVVTSVSSKEVVIVDAGTRLPLEIGTGTRILRDGKAIRVNQLKEGEKVRAVVNIVGKSHTREIAVLSKAEARRAAGLH
ncbi:hypothetical protein D7Y13_35230 [Corallococcus praedator]|uniref:DUF5666 domain-containing protein n=2 Tax=Myxococcaceae TaxID=31 RepID=A0ABX9Q9P5_9BACT|nr:hypothetical protein D7X75_36910 [Corallococcus sp. CA031C]RKH92850.1 hypothetical protein D7Y13_35230 [Corallococcus praedator]